jgi:hypothetical protein
MIEDVHVPSTSRPVTSREPSVAVTRQRRVVVPVGQIAVRAMGYQHMHNTLERPTFGTTTRRASILTMRQCLEGRTVRVGAAGPSSQARSLSRHHNADDKCWCHHSV